MAGGVSGEVTALENRGAEMNENGAGEYGVTESTASTIVNSQGERKACGRVAGVGKCYRSVFMAYWKVAKKCA